MKIFTAISKDGKYKHKMKAHSLDRVTATLKYHYPDVKEWDITKGSH